MAADKLSPYPLRIAIEMTPLCNLACPMCPRNYINGMDGFITATLWKKLIDEIAATAQDVIILPFWRGESLLHPHFAELLEYALDKSLRIHISTNGELVTGEYAGVIARCEFVTFSIHTLLGYANAKKFLSFKKNGLPTVQVSFVEGEKTAEKLLDILTATPDLEGFNSVRLYEEHSKDGQFGKSGYTMNAPRTFCPKLSDTLVIAADGTISRCNHIWETENSVNLDQSSIKDAWGSTCLEQIRNNYPDKYCAPCDQWTGHTCGESWRLANGKKEHQIFSPLSIA